MFLVNVILVYSILINLNGIVHSQEVDFEDIIDRIDRIERNVSDLQKKEIGEIDKNLTTGYISRNESRIDSIETLNRTNFGKLEEIENLIKNLENKIDLINVDFDQRIKNIESNFEKIENFSEEKISAYSNYEKETKSFDNSELDTLGKVDKETKTDKSQTDEKELKSRYENAIKLLWGADYDKALSELKDLKNFNPTDLMPNIQYWLGEVYYAKKDFNRAVIEFGEGLKQYPDSIKGPDNMLKLGLSFSNLNQKVDACNVLYELEIKYPDVPKNILEISNLERKKLSCPEE